MSTGPTRPTDSAAARALAAQMLDERWRRDLADGRARAESGGYAVIPGDEEESEAGWVFHWQSRRWLATRAHVDVVRAAPPIVVTRDGRASFRELDAAGGGDWFGAAIARIAAAEPAAPVATVAPAVAPPVTAESRANYALGRAWFAIRRALGWWGAAERRAFAVFARAAPDAFEPWTEVLDRSAGEARVVVWSGGARQPSWVVYAVSEPAGTGRGDGTPYRASDEDPGVVVVERSAPAAGT